MKTQCFKEKHQLISWSDLEIIYHDPHKQAHNFEIRIYVEGASSRR